MGIVMPYFATCARGLEPILARELTELGAATIEPGRGGVAFHGDHALLYRANLQLRTAVRVLRPLKVFRAASAEELYENIAAIDWSEWMTPDQTLAVDCNVRDSALTHSLYAAQRTKDAICDQFLKRVGRRPSVDRDEPMIGLNLHIHRDEAVLSLDSSGDSLHKRGYRPIQTKAPLNEALAAGLILHSGWDGSRPLADPLCGSGTFLIEGAWLALRRPPGLTRKRFGFMGWLDFKRSVWTAVRDEARAAVRRELSVPILGSDRRSDALRLAVANARAAGVGHLLKFHKADVKAFVPPEGEPGTIICNPPYGERIGTPEELQPLYRTLGEVFGSVCRGWRCFVFTSNSELARAIGLRPHAKTHFFNGKLDCHLYEYRPR